MATMTTTTSVKSINSLLPDWSAMGNDLKAFFAELEDLDSRTEYERLKLSSISWLSIIENGVFGKTRITVPDGVWAICPISKFKHEGEESKVLGMKKANVIIEGTEKEKDCLSKEIEAVGGLLSYCKSNEKGRIKVLPLSPWAFKDLAERAGIMCEKINIRGITRDKWLVDNFTANEVTLVKRRNKGGDLNKVVSIRGRVYNGIEQAPHIKGVVDFLVEDLGEATCKEWSITNECTRLTLNFKDKLEEIEAMYPTLPKGIMPMIKITTSDIGKNAFTVSAGFNVDGFEMLHKSGTVSCIHDSKLNIDKLTKEIQKKCFPEFISIPKKLAELLSIEVDNPGVAIEEVLDYIKLEKRDGLKFAAQAIKEQLTLEFAFGRYTAYDIVSSLMTIMSRIKLTKKGDGSVRELPEASLSRLNEALSQAIFCPFETCKSTYTIF